MKHLLLIAAAFLWILSATSCATRLAGGPYTSPDGAFSCRLPTSPGGWAVQRHSMPGAKGAAFLDDFDGTLYRVELIDTRLLPQSFHSQARREQLMTTLERSVLPLIRSTSPAARMISQSYLPGLKGGTAYAVFDVPGGSAMAVRQGAGPATRPDVIRNVMVFRTPRWLVVVSHVGEHLGSLIHPGSRPAAASQAARDFPALEGFARSVQVNE